MRILLINKFHYPCGGADRAYFDMARILTERGHTVAFFSMLHPQNRPTPWAKYFVDSVDYHAALSLCAQWRAAWRILWNGHAQKQLAALITDFKPDVAHCHNIYHQLSPSIIATLKKYSIPVVMTLHDYKLISPSYTLFARGKVWERAPLTCPLDRCVGNSFLWSILCTVEHYAHRILGIYQRVDRFIAPSTFLIKTFRKHGFVKEITYLPQPLITDAREDGAMASLSTGDHSHPISTQPFVLYAGRLSVEKGVSVLIDAISLLLARGKKIPCIIAGDGIERSALEERARTQGCAAMVTFMGYQPQTVVRNLQQHAHAVVVPSVWYENRPYSLEEALAAGALVIGSNSGGIAERITDGTNGFLFETGNASALADALERVWHGDCTVVRNKALQSAHLITPAQYGKRLEEIYTEVIDKNQ